MHPPVCDLFISYRSTDLPLAERLHERLSRAGFRVWFDKARLRPGCNWHREIEAECEASRIILPVLTPSWQESEWCRFETYGGEHVIPLLFAGEWTQVAPLPLHAYQFVDLRHPSEATWDALLASIRDDLSRPHLEKGPRLASLPYAHNPYFVGREPVLLEIHERLSRTPTTALTQGTVHAVAGMGGVGKTTLAREYAETFWRLYQDILWVRADPALLTTEFARLALELRLIPQPSQDANEDARRALRELAGRTPRLLILDNAVDEESVQQWIPTSGGCRTIITSRFSGWSAAVPTVGVDVLAPESARELLLRRSDLAASEDNVRAADRVSSELGYLPLALEQAAAFVRKVRIDFDQYLQWYAQSRRELLAQGSLGGTQYPDSVATTWRTTVGRLGPLARAILRLASFLAPDDIPVSMLEGAGDLLRDGAAELQEADVPEGVESNPLALRLALGELTDYSMISLRQDGLSVHRLVQAVQSDELDEPTRRMWAERAVLAVNRAFPDPVFSNWALCARLLAHTRFAATLVTQWHLEFQQMARLLNQVASYLHDRAQYPQSEPLYRQALEIARTALGEDHPDFATCLNNLADLYQVTGNYAAAEPLYRQALEIRRKAPMEDFFAQSLISLAELYAAKGDIAAAEPLLRQAMEIMRTALGVCLGNAFRHTACRFPPGRILAV